MSFDNNDDVVQFAELLAAIGGGTASLKLHQEGWSSRLFSPAGLTAKRCSVMSV
jgi:hypothetical protein